MTAGWRRDPLPRGGGPAWEKAALARWALAAPLLLVCVACNRDNRAPSGGADVRLDQFEQAVEALDVQEPTEQEPVRLNATLVPAHASAGETVVAVLKVRLLAGWRLYSSVPDSSPYIESTPLLEHGPELQAVDGWSGPEGRLLHEGEGLSVLVGEASPLVFLRELVVQPPAERVPAEGRASGMARVSVGFAYQTCNAEVCLAPTQKTIDLSFRIDEHAAGDGLPGDSSR